MPGLTPSFTVCSMLASVAWTKSDWLEKEQDEAVDALRQPQLWKATSSPTEQPADVELGCCHSEHLNPPNSISISSH